MFANIKVALPQITARVKEVVALFVVTKRNDTLAELAVK